jgi:hypothetical protein
MGSAVTIDHQVLVRLLGGDSLIVEDPLETLLSKSAIATRVAAINPSAVKDLLLRKSNKATSLNLPGTLESSGSAKSPARAASTLVFGRVNGTSGDPVNGSG